MSSLRRPPSRFGVIPRAVFFVGAILLALGLFFGVLAGALALRVAWERRADRDWKPPVEDPKGDARRAAIARGVPAAALDPSTRPATVALREPQPIAMWASDASLSPQGVKLSGKRDQVIADWRGEDAAVTWSVDPAAGEYHVDLTYACRNEEGGDFVVTVGDQAVKGRAVPTTGSVGGRKATNYSTVRVATLKLAEGPITVEVRPDGLPKNSLMSLLRVDLIPPGAPGAGAAVAMAQALEVDGDEDAGGKADKRDAKERAEAKERHRRAAERAAAAADEMVKWKQMAAERSEFDRRARQARAEKSTREAEERKARQREAELAADRKREERKAQAKREKAERPPRPVTALALLDAADGRTLEKLKNGATVNLAALPAGRVTVRAVVDDEEDEPVGSVRFAYDAQKDFATDNNHPFIANGGGGDRPIRPMPLSPGKHTLAATTYAGPDATGLAGRPHTVAFTVVDDSKLIGTGGMIVGFTLIDTDKKRPVATISEGAELDIKSIAKHVTIRAETAGAISSVRFDLSGGPGKSHKHLEGAAPYTLNGDDAGKTYHAYELKPGNYRLSAFPFSEPEGKGKAGRSMSVKFEVVD